MLRKNLAVSALIVCISAVSLASAHEKPDAKTSHGAKTASTAKRGKSSKAGAVRTMTLTSSSAKARDLYQRAVLDFELMRLERANIGWRAAAKEDPNFAAAFAMVALNSRDPEEVRTAREQAKALAVKSSAGEKLMIEWVTAVQEGKYLEGIIAMNGLTAMFPRDKHLHYLAANWLMGVRGDEQAHRLLHQALEIDPDFAPALNNLAYLHARNLEFDEALQDMDRYAALLPKEPNPQDSYGEILRMAGRFEASLEHYRASLAIDPNFNISQGGLGDTYTLMGDQEKARQEYDKAIQNEPSIADRFDYRMQRAITWVREKKYAEADRELWRISVEAHGLGYDLQEAQALRRMAQYAADDQLALERLTAAEDALTHRQNLSQSDRDEELAEILRVRAARFGRAGKQEEARKALNQLEELAGANTSRTIQQCWHGAAGASLAAHGNFKEAIPELEEDQENPETLVILARAYRETAANDKGKAVEDRLKATHLPTLERVLALDEQAALPPQIKDPVAAK